MFWPSESFPDWVQIIGNLLPLGYPSKAVTSVLIRGKGLCSVVVVLNIFLLAGTVLWQSKLHTGLGVDYVAGGHTINWFIGFFNAIKKLI